MIDDIKDLSRALNEWRRAAPRHRVQHEAGVLHKALCLDTECDNARDERQSGLRQSDYDFWAQFRGGVKI